MAPEFKGGYMGATLRIYLSAKKAAKEPLAPNAARAFLGAKGLAAYYLFKEILRGAAPLSAEDKFAAFTGPLTGVTGAPALVRTVVVIKSPLTGGWTDWYFGGS